MGFDRGAQEGCELKLGKRGKITVFKKVRVCFCISHVCSGKKWGLRWFVEHWKMGEKFKRPFKNFPSNFFYIFPPSTPAHIPLNVNTNHNFVLTHHKVHQTFHWLGDLKIHPSNATQIQFRNSNWKYSERRNPRDLQFDYMFILCVSQVMLQVATNINCFFSLFLL